MGGRLLHPQRRQGSALVVIDETLIPSEYVRTRREIDMPAALAALKNGKDVPGARLSNGAPRLTIRDR